MATPATTSSMTNGLSTTPAPTSNGMNGSTGSGGIATTSSSSLNSYSPISTLERQYERPLGERLMIFVGTNPQCCLEGGVESILKLNGRTDLLANAESNFEETAEDDFDAFAFLNEAASAESNGSMGSQQQPQTSNGIGGFFRKVAASTTSTLERKMQGLAVRMDKGRNPDLLRVALYDPTTQEMLGVTDSRPLPKERKDVRFHIPLVLSGKRRKMSIQIKLWIQSGAALLQSTKVAKNYLLGMATIDSAKLQLGGVTTITLTSNLVVDGQLHLCAMPDPKFTKQFHRGWSLTDPDMSAYSNNLCNLPLDQSYLMHGKEPNHWITAVERSTESSIVLPIAAACMELASKACHRSLLHSQSVGKILRCNRHDFKDPTKATCDLGVIGIATASTIPRTAFVSIAWRRPDSIFELELAINSPIPFTNEKVAAAFPAMSLKFFPKVCTTDILPGILNAYGGKLPPAGYLLGALHFAVTIQTSDQVEMWEAVVGLESFVNHPGSTIQVPLHKNGQPMGNILLQLQVQVPSDRTVNKVSPATDGLVSLVGLEALADGVEPSMDLDPKPEGAALSLRHQQLATMGFFCTTQYMEQHLAIRQSGFEAFQERSRAYKQALVQPQDVEPCKTKSPKAFRPSSSRLEALLSGIPFNAHVATLDISVTDGLPNIRTNSELPGAQFHNITCGAPSDHARGFGNVLEKISNTNASGGLRRLEAKRLECAQELQQAQSLLIAGVGNYLGTARKTAQVNHVPARHAELQGLRWKVFECVHNLHHITWMCAVRRANVFSQALGLAVSSYLTSISDSGRCAAGWPPLWQRHGYLVSFEGLLTAAGKELGMIEDASVAIAMLRMVRVVLMPDNGVPSKAVQVPSSPYLKWVNLFPSGEGGTNRTFILQIGIDAQYYNERIPPALQNGAAVQFYPLLYQVGVDIRQWGVNTGTNIIKQGSRAELEGASSNGSGSGGAAIVASSSGSSGGLMDDEDDDGVRDDDVLVALNYEALRKMNAYAHAINPQSISLDKVQAAMHQVFAPQTIQSLSQPLQALLPVHPSLSLLHSHIVSSAGKMNHSIVDEAATIAQQLGGGGVVFCKSGKDRTAMHLTFKQAQFGARYRDEHDPSVTLQEANIMRVYGTRLPICEKNVGQAKYAFNSLQVKFMPDALRPPMNTLAGFLKGGRLFGEGAIES